ncbi:MAG: LA_1612 family putative O-antigen biosynthesis protein [Ilumatobacteraceae bacterium]
MTRRIDLRRDVRLLRSSRAGRRLQWSQPRPVDVAILFSTDAELIASLCPTEAIAVIDPGDGPLHLGSALRALRRGRPRGRNYFAEMLSRYRPRVVLTAIDNYPDLFSLKAEFPQVTFICVQNGVRGWVDDTLGEIHSLAEHRLPPLDHAFTFGPTASALLPPRLYQSIHPTGSLRNNAAPIGGGPRSGLAYISTYRPWLHPDDLVPVTPGGRRVTYRELHEAREHVVRFLAGYCKDHGLQLTVIGKNTDVAADQRYYDSIIGAGCYRLSARTDALASYRAVDTAEIVVFTSSTLGYEALARGGKVAALTVGGSLLGCREHRFGWPGTVSDDGPFWTNDQDPRRFRAILDEVRLMSDTEWTSTASPVINPLMVHDIDNATLRHTIRESLDGDAESIAAIA